MNKSYSPATLSMVCPRLERRVHAIFGGGNETDKRNFVRQEGNDYPSSVGEVAGGREEVKSEVRHQGLHLESKQ